MANNIASYLKNVGKSVAYATTDVFKDKFESSSSFVDANQELFKELYGYAKDYKKTIDKAGVAIQGSKIYQAGDQYIAKLKEDIKSGKWYNKDREDDMYTKSMGELGDFSDMGMDLEDFDFDSDEDVVVKPKLSKDGASVTSAIQASARVSAEAISGSVIDSADYLARTNKANAKVAFAQGNQIIQSISSGFATMTSGLGTINQNLEAVSIHTENSRKFFESTSTKLDAMTQLLKEINEREAKMYGQQQKEASRTSKVSYGDITSNGMPDLKAYGSNVAKNIKKAMGPNGDMLFGDTFGEGSNMLMAFVTSPMSFLPKMLVNSIMPKGLDKAAKGLDKTMSGLFGNMIAQFNKLAKGDNGILKTIGEIFGISSNVKSTIDTTKYQKGPVPFDGIVKKSITEVIPGHLRRIEKLLGAKEERFFDYDTGKWITSKDINTKFKNIKQDSVKNAFSEAMPYFKEMFDSVIPEQKKQYDELMKNFSDVLEGIYDNYGSFRFNDKRTSENYYEYGANSESQMKMIMKMFQQLPHDISTQIASKVLEARSSQNREMSRLEEDSYSPLMHKFDNSINQRDIDRAQALAEGKNVNNNAKYAPFNILMESKDEKGYNIFNYMRNMLSELMIIRDNTRDIGGSSSFSGGNHPKPRGGSGLNLRDEDGKLKLQDLIPNYKGKEELDAEKNRIRNQNSYARRREEAIKKGKTIDIDIQDGNSLSDEDLVSTRGMFELIAARRDRKDRKEATETETWFQKMISENAEKANKNDSSGKKMTLYDQLTQAENISKKWEVVKNNFAQLVEKPGQAFVSIIQGADKRLYELMFGYDTGTGIDGKPIKGFIGFTTDQIKRSFQKVNDWIDNSLTSLKEKLGVDSFGELFSKLLDKIGLTEDRRKAIKDKAKDIVRPFTDSIKETFSSAYQGTKNAVIDTVSPAINKVRGAVSNEELQKKYDRSAQTEDIPYANVLANIRPSDLGIFSGNGVFYNADGTIVTQEQREAIKKKLGPGGKITRQTGQSEIQKRITLAAQEASTSNDAMDQAYTDWNYLSEEEKSKTTIGKFIKDRADAIKKADEARKAKQEKEAKAKNSIKEAADKAKADIEQNADGTRYVKKTGLTAISEGEMIIPADMNPFNPNKNSVNRKNQLQKEKTVANGFISNIVSSLSKNIKFNANGVNDTTGQLNETVDATVHGGEQKAGEFIGDVKEEGKQIGQEIKDATVRIIYGDEKKTNEALKGALKDVTSHIKEYAPDTVSHGLLGGLIGTGVSLLTGVVGGPLLGAAAGAAVGLVKKSSGLQNWLFGDIDKETGERKGGVFSKKLQSNFKKYFPTMKNYGITGALAGIVTPLGPIGGLMVGSAVGFLKKNEKFGNYLFGEMNEETGEREDNGIIKKKAQDFIKKSLPRAAIGTTAAMFIGPFGLLGNAAIGAGVGMLTSTDKFKDAVFGKVNEDTGEREGGVVGAIHTGIIEPLKGALVEFKDEFKVFMHDKVMDPLSRFIEPVGQDIKNMFKDIGDSVSTFMNNRFEKSLGIPLEAFVKQRFFDPLGKFFKNITGGFMAPFKAVIGAPFKMLGAYGDTRRRSQIKEGKATNMTADERMAFMRERPGILGKLFNKDGNYKLKNFDEMIANADASNLNEMEELLTDLVGGKGAFEKKIGTEKHDMSNEVTNFIKKNKLDGTIKYAQLKDILEAASSGDLEKARTGLQKRGINGKRLEIDDQNEIFEMLKARSETLQKLQARKDNAGREKTSLYKDLESMGLKGINEKNQRWFLDNISTEAKARAKNGDINPENAADPVLAKIQENSIKAANENAQNIINKLNDIKNVFAYFTGVDENGDEVKRPVKGRKGIYNAGLTAGDLVGIDRNLEKGQLRDQKINDKDRAKVAGVKKSFGNIYDIDALEKEGAVFSANTSFGIGGRGQKMVNLHNTEGSAQIKQDAVTTALAIDDASWGLILTIQTAGYALSSEEMIEVGRFSKLQRLNVYAVLKPNPKNRSFYYRTIRSFDDIKTISKFNKETVARVKKFIVVGWGDRNIDQLITMSKDVKQLNAAIHGPDRSFNPATGKIEEKESSKKFKDKSGTTSSDNEDNNEDTSTGATGNKTSINKKNKRSFTDTIFGRKYVEVNNKGEVATADDAESKEVEAAQKNFRSIFAGKAAKLPLIGGFLSKLINPSGKDQSSKKDSDEEEDNEGGFISKLLKSKVVKVIGGAIGGVTAVAAAGHIGQWWEEKAWPSVKNFLTENPIGEKIVNAITGFKYWVAEMFTNVFDWFRAEGKYKGKGFPYFWQNGIIPWYVDGIGYFLENIVPGAVSLIIKALPTIIGSAAKGLSKILTTSITSLFGHKSLANRGESSVKVETDQSLGDALKSSMGGSSGGTMSTPQASWLKQHFGSAISSYKKVDTDGSYEMFVGKGDSDNSQDTNGIKQMYDPSTGLTSWAYQNENGTTPISAAYANGEVSQEDYYNYLISSGVDPETALAIINQTDNSNEDIAGNNQNGVVGKDQSIGGSLLKGILRAPFSSKGATKVINGVGNAIGKIPFKPFKMLGNGIKGYANIIDTIKGAAANISAKAGTTAARSGNDIINKAVSNLDDILKSNNMTVNSKGIISKVRGSGIDTAATIAEKAGVSKDVANTIMKIGKNTDPTKIVDALAGSSDDVIEGIAKLGNSSSKAVNEAIKGAAGHADDLVEKSSGILNKIKAGLDKIMAKNGFISKKIASIGSKITGKAISVTTKLANTACGKIASRIVGVIKKAGAKTITALGKILPVLNIVLVAADFATGFDNAAGILGIKSEDVNMGERLICGLLKAINGYCLLGIIPESSIVDIFVDFIGPIIGIDMTELKEQRAEAEQRVIDWNNNNPDEQYESVYAYETKDNWTTKVKNTVGKVTSAIGNGAKNVWNWITGKGNKAADAVKTAGSAAADSVYKAGAKVSPKVAADRLSGTNQELFNGMNMYETIDTATGMPIYVDADTGIYYDSTGKVINYNNSMYGMGDGTTNTEYSTANYTGTNPATGVYIDVQDIASKASVSEDSKERIANNINDLLDNAIDTWNNNIQTLVDLVSDENFIKTEEVFTAEYKADIKSNTIKNIQSSVYNAWEVANALAMDQWQSIFALDDKKKRNTVIGATAGGVATGAATGAIIGSGTMPIVGTLIGAGVGALVGWFAGKVANEEYDNSKIEKDSVKAIGDLSSNMIDLYNSQLAISVDWLNKGSQDITKQIEKEEKDKLLQLAKGKVVDAVESAWTIACELALAQWQTVFNYEDTTKSNISTGAFIAGAGTGAAIGATIGSAVPVVGTLIGAGVGALVGWFASKVGEDIYDMSQVEDDTVNAISTLSTGMINLYNSKLTWSVKWIDEIASSSDMMTTDHKQIMMDGVKDNLVKAIGSAWAVAEELSQAEWNKALGLDMGFNFWSTFTKVAVGGAMGAGAGAIMGGGALSVPGAIIGAGVGIFGALWDNIDKATSIDNGAEASINNLMNKMSLLYNTKLTATTTWLDEMMSSSDMMTTDHKQTMVDLTKSNLVKAIGSAWSVAEELSIAKWNKALGLDPSYNFWSGVKDFAKDTAEITMDNIGLAFIPVIGPAIAAGVGVIGAIWNKFESANTIDTATEDAINNLTGSMNKVYMNGLNQSQGWLDEITADNSFMTEDDKDILRNQTRRNLRIAISSAWVTASELAKSKWNKSLGLDPGYNFWNGAAKISDIITESQKNDESIIGNLWKAFTDSLKPDEEVQTSIDTLTQSMKTTWNKNLVSSLDIMKEEDTFALSDDDKKSLIDNTRTKLTDMILTAWGVANDLTVKKFNKSLGLDPSFNFMNGMNTLIDASNEAANNSKTVIGILWNKYSTANVEDTEVSSTVDTLVSNMENLWLNKIGATKQFIEDAKTDTKFVKQRDKDDLVDIARDGLVEMLNTTWGVASNINIRKWKIASNYVSSNYGVIGTDMANAYGMYGTNTTTQLSDEDKVKYEKEISGVEDVVTSIEDLWIHKLNTMLTLVNAGSASSVNIVPEQNEDLWKPIDDGVEDVSKFYNNNKLDLKDTKIDFRKYLTNGKPRESEAFYGLKSMIYYDQKLYGMVPLTFNRITTEAAKEFKSFGKDITSGMTYANTITKTVSNEIAKVNANTQLSKLFKEMNDKNPIKNIIYWMEKVISFPLYLAKFMTKKMKDLEANDTINNLYGGIENLADKISGKNKGKTNKKSGMGPGVNNSEGEPKGENNGIDSGIPDFIVNQGDQGIAGISYNNAGDKVRQTIKDSGCAPVNATNVINTLYGKDTIDVKKAASFALQNGYKEDNGGTTIDYFQSIFNKYGINSENTTDPNAIVSGINSGKPVVLLGENGKFGNSSHYMTVNSVDSFGNATIMDPNTSNKIDTYNIKDILKNTKGATIVKNTNSFSAPKNVGFGKFKKLSGYGVQVSDEKLVSITAEIISKSEGDYSSINKNDNGSMSIGKIQWNANVGRALPVLKAIVNLNPSKAKSTLGNALYNEINGSNSTAWNHAGRKCSATEEAPLKALLGSPEGIKAQNATIVADIPAYFSSIRKRGFNDPAVLIYLSDASNQFGAITALNKVTGAADNLTAVHNKFKSNCNSIYHPRRDKCYKMCLDWQSYNGLNINEAASILSNGEVSNTDSSTGGISNLLDYFSQLGTEMVKKIYGEDYYNALYGNSSSNEENGNGDIGITNTLNGGVTINDKGDVVAVSVPRSGNMANNFPYYNQIEDTYGNYKYGSYGNIRSHGCGPTAMAMVANSYGINTDPTKTTDYTVNNGYATKNGTINTVFSKYFKEMNKKVKQYYLTDSSRGAVANNAYNALKQGKPVIAGVDTGGKERGTFTKGGHFIDLVGVDENGRVIVNDPSSESRTNNTYDLSTFKNEITSASIISDNNDQGSIGHIKSLSGSGKGVKSSWLSGMGSGVGNINAPKLNLDTYSNKSVANNNLINGTRSSQANIDNSSTVENNNRQINYAKFFLSIIDILTKVSDNTSVLNAILSFLKTMNVNISSEDAKNLNKKTSSVTRESAKTNVRNQLNASGAYPSTINQNGSTGGVSKEMQYIIDAMTKIAKE